MQEQASPARFHGVHNIIKSINKFLIPTEIYKLLTHPDSRYKFKMKGSKMVGHFPYLLMKIKDPELKELAGVGHTKNDKKMNNLWQHECPNFDDIDCEDISCTCAGFHPYDFQLVYGQVPTDPDTLLYRSCKRTLFAAAKRQMKAAPHPDPKTAREFIIWAKAKIDEWMDPYLKYFKYSFDQWYNHLNSKKQRDMDKVRKYLYDKDGCEIEKGVYHYRGVQYLEKELHYEGLTKKELQPMDGKPRMVCSIPKLIKFVMGPITWALEEIFAKHFPVYCGGMNFTQMEDKINHYIDEGFTLVTEGDGSAFDNTQDDSLKTIDRYIYEKVEPYVYHVPRDLFHFISHQHYKIMDIKHTDPYSKKKQTLFTYAILGTVFSGDCDTTLMNTIRMGLYNWFTNHKMHLEINEHYVCFSKGDDFTVMYNPVKLVDIEYAERGYRKYWLAKNKPNGDTKECDDRVYGIGQILKFIEFGQSESLKFCSLRAWIKNPKTNHIYLTRDPMRLFTQGKYSRKILNMKSAEKYIYLCQQAEALRISYPKINIFNKVADIIEAEAEIFKNKIRQETLEKAKLKICKTTDAKRKKLIGETLANMFDEVGYREDEEKLLDGMSYWESISKIYYVNLTQLNDDEAAEVNRQMDIEFSEYIQHLSAGLLFGI